MIIGKKNENEVDFPSKDLWFGVGSNYAINLTIEQIEDLHKKIHEWEILCKECSFLDTKSCDLRIGNYPDCFEKIIKLEILSKEKKE